MVKNSSAKSVLIAFWNLNWGTRQSKDQLIIDHALKTYPNLGIFAGVEAKVDTFLQMFPEKTWRIVQSTKNLSERNVGVAWLRTALMNPKVRALRKGVDNHGVRMLPRPLRIIDFDLASERVRLIIGHNAPHRFKFLQPLFNASVKFRINCRSWSRAGRWVYCADNNMPIGEVARILGGTAHGEGIDAIIVGKAMKLTDVVVDRLPKQKGWTDHVGVVGVLSLKPRM